MSNAVVQSIYYVNTNKKEVTARDIIRVEPFPNITAIDVTGMNPEEVATMLAQYQEYLDYRDVAAKSLYSFEDWAEMTTSTPITPVWKAFKTSHILDRK